MWRNIYQKGAPTPTFANPVRVVDTSLCPQSDANGNLYDLAVRFGDLDGDRRVDVSNLVLKLSQSRIHTHCNNSTSAPPLPAISKPPSTHPQASAPSRPILPPKSNTAPSLPAPTSAGQTSPATARSISCKPACQHSFLR
jgi:hypothetical protein